MAITSNCYANITVYLNMEGVLPEDLPKLVIFRVSHRSSQNNIISFFTASTDRLIVAAFTTTTLSITAVSLQAGRYFTTRTSHHASNIPCSAAWCCALAGTVGFRTHTSTVIDIPPSIRQTHLDMFIASTLTDYLNEIGFTYSNSLSHPRFVNSFISPSLKQLH